MKQQIITGLKKKLLLVEFPNIKCELAGIRGSVLYYYDEMMSKDDYPISVELSEVIELIGSLTGITEEQYRQWVYGYPTMLIGSNVVYYKSYLSGGGLDTAKESFFSKLESHGIQFENPLGKKPHLGMFIEQKGNCVQDFDEVIKNWQEAQEKVWDKDRCWVFEVIN